MRVFQLVMAVISGLMMITLFCMSFWVKNNFSKGVPLATCYMPISVITTVCVLITIATIFIRK
jgi:hypothetical protein